MRRILMKKRRARHEPSLRPPAAVRCDCARWTTHELPHLGTGSAETRSEEHTSELQSLMRISYAVFCLKKKNTIRPLLSTDTATHLLHPELTLRPKIRV